MVPRAPPGPANEPPKVKAVYGPSRFPEEEEFPRNMELIGDLMIHGQASDSKCSTPIYFRLKNRKPLLHMQSMVLPERCSASVNLARSSLCSFKLPGNGRRQGRDRNKTVVCK